MKEYELCVPLTYNDGSPIEPKKLIRIRERLLEQFGNITYFPQENEGFWTMGNVTFRDRIVIYRIITGEVRAARQFFRQIKVPLRRELKQEDILIVEKDALIL